MYCDIISAISLILSELDNIFSIFSGIFCNSFIILSYFALLSPLFLPKNNANSKIQVICAANALVEATHISAPALVNRP